MTDTSSRRGYTLLELLVVVTILLILGAVLVPTMAGMFRDTRTKATADQVRNSLGEARSFAVQHGYTYVVAVSADGKQIRVTVDDPDGLIAPGSGVPTNRTEDVEKEVTLKPLSSDGQQPVPDASGWYVLASYKADGTCLESSAEVQVEEPGVLPMIVSIRGLTGGSTTSVSKTPATAGAAR